MGRFSDFHPEALIITLLLRQNIVRRKKKPSPPNRHFFQAANGSLAFLVHRLSISIPR